MGLGTPLKEKMAALEHQIRLAGRDCLFRKDLAGKMPLGLLSKDAPGRHSNYRGNLLRQVRLLITFRGAFDPIPIGSGAKVCVGW
jgi:hypothetical protein